MAEASQVYEQLEANRKWKLEKNSEEQEKLKKRLAELGEEKRNLEQQLEEGSEEEDKAKMTRVVTLKQVDEWQGKIIDLQKKVDTSLKILTDVTGAVWVGVTFFKVNGERMCKD